MVCLCLLPSMVLVTSTASCKVISVTARYSFPVNNSSVGRMYSSDTALFNIKLLSYVLLSYELLS